MNIFHGTILGGNADDYEDDDVHLIEGQPEHLPRNNGSLSEGSSPEVCGITATEKVDFILCRIFSSLSPFGFMI